MYFSRLLGGMWKYSGDILGVRIKKGKVYKAVIVELKQKSKRFTHLNRSFGRNLVVLVNAKGDPIGTRVSSLASYELRAAGHAKIASISPYLF